MAAGWSDRQKYNRIRTGLGRIQRDLEKAGIQAIYERRTLRGEGFAIWYHGLNASNGESALLAHIHITLGNLDEHYEFLDFERGLDRLKQLYSLAEVK